MAVIIWKLEGHSVKEIRATGAHVQDAFTRLSARDRQLITLYCTTVSTEPENKKAEG